MRREAGFVEAARLVGQRRRARAAAATSLPNILPLMMVQMSLTMGWAILNAAGLSFIGLGVRPPTPEWGIMVAEGANFIISGEWWVALFPGAALMLAVFCFNLLGDGLRDIIDPEAGAHDRRRPLLAVEDLSVEFRTRSGTVQALEHVGFSVDTGETVALVGESGSGKSVTAFAVMGILDAAGARHRRAAPCSAAPTCWRSPSASSPSMRGRELAMIFQNPRTALNPIRTVGQQIADVLRAPRRRHAARCAARARSRCWRACASPIPSAAPTPIPSSCRAACASAS